MSEAKPSCGESCNGCGKKKHVDEPKTEDKRKNEEHPKSCETCHKHVKPKQKPKSCKCKSSSYRKEKECLNDAERFLAYHEQEEFKAPGINEAVCRDIHCKDHYKRPPIKPSSIETNVPPATMMPPHPMMYRPRMVVPPMVYHQRPPFYHPDRPMYPPLPPPPPQYSTYDRSMQRYRSPYGGGYRDNFW